MNGLGDKIRKIREIKGLTQEYVAAKLAISQKAYSKLERNEQVFNWDRLAQLGQIFEIDPVDLVTFDDSIIFNHCTQSGKMNTINNYLSEELLKSFLNRIEHLEKEVEFLRTLIASVPH